ncbi:CpaF family protein [Ornithinimicrobium sediminis]|uniref:CpaF family protein n=1 Tax=Ornithinimicrobium sediminis TaxID=2904603 RepID=UPI001E4D6D0D|nr:CpaF family protein [Ornithinimicrobium sediminis]MCE0488186.1 CpaF family protein [Ornithinimicrobium sediminis]
MNLAERLEAARKAQSEGASPGSSSSPSNGGATNGGATNGTHTGAPTESAQVPSERLTTKASRPTTETAASSAPPVTPPASAASPPTASAGLARFKARAREELFERLGARLNDPDLDEAKLNELVRQELTKLVNDSPVSLKSDERRRLIADLTDDVLGYGPLQPFLDDDAVTEIMVNGPDHVYVEVGGRLKRADARFGSEEHLRRVIERIVSRVGRRIDESSPLVDARLEDGSRVNAIIPPLAFSGSTLTIRKFGKKPLLVDDLVARGSLSPPMVALLRASVEAKLSILVSGGTGTGKTTLLNVLSSFIPHDERIVTIEDAVELQLQQEHVVRLEARPRNIEGRGEVTIRDLVRNSLRMRPDRIIVGEVRGGESLDMLQAMNTGHEGSLSTLHANTPRDAIARLETMVLMAGMDLPLRAIREQIASAIDVIVHLTRMRDGTRRVTHVTEVQGMEGDIITLQDAFAFDYSAGVDHTGRFLGTTRSTGVRPHFTDHFAELGIELPASVFETAPMRSGR